MAKLWWGWVLLVVLLPACVKKSTYEDLEARYHLSQDTLVDRTKRVNKLESELAQLEQAHAALVAAHERVSAELAALLQDRSSLQASVEEMQRALLELEQRKAEAEARVAEYRDFVAKFQVLIDQGKLKVKVRDGRLVVQLATDILFASGKAELSPEGLMAIREVGAVLATIGDKRFQIEGHTDDVPIKTSRYPSNWELAAARAITVVKTLIDAGMGADSVSAASFGESSPAVANDSPENRASNRRIEIVVVPDLSSLPGFNELQNLGR